MTCKEVSEEKSYPGENGTRRKRTYGLQETFSCRDPELFFKKKGGSPRNMDI